MNPRKRWALQIFQTSLLKQQKWRMLSSLLGPTDHLRCLDVGADSGVLSLLFRERGGSWASADITAEAVASIRSLVGTDVHLIQDGQALPFESETFDKVVIIDILEHLRGDHVLMGEIARILKTDGEVIINVPHAKKSILTFLRKMLGQTDETHGNVRSGYTEESLQKLLRTSFTIVRIQTYSRFFSQMLDALTVWAVGKLRGQQSGASAKTGGPVTGAELDRHKGAFIVYRILFPFMWLTSLLDGLFFWRSGHLLATKARVTKVNRVVSVLSDRVGQEKIQGRILVTGATGFAGSVLVRKLKAQGLSVVAFARGKVKADHLADLNLEWVWGDVTDAKAVAKAVSGCAYVFHIAGSFRNTAASEAEHHAVDVLGTQNVARAAANEKGLKRFVHVSTIGVHGHIEEPPADETYRFKPGDAYQRAKVEGERWVRKFSVESGLPLTVVRPAAIYGPSDTRLFKLFKMANSGWFPLVGRGDGLLHLVHVNDLANFMIVCATHPKALGEVFICGEPKPVSLRSLVRLIARTYGRQVHFIRFPAAPSLWIAGLCEAVCQPLGVRPPIFRRRIEFYINDRAFNTRKMTDVLGFEASVRWEQGVVETAKWYKTHGWLSARPAEKNGSRSGEYFSETTEVQREGAAS